MQEMECELELSHRCTLDATDDLASAQESQKRAEKAAAEHSDEVEKLMKTVQMLKYSEKVYSMEKTKGERSHEGLEKEHEELLTKHTQLSIEYSSLVIAKKDVDSRCNKQHGMISDLKEDLAAQNKELMGTRVAMSDVVEELDKVQAKAVEDRSELDEERQLLQLKIKDSEAELQRRQRDAELLDSRLSVARVAAEGRDVGCQYPEEVDAVDWYAKLEAERLTVKDLESQLSQLRREKESIEASVRILEARVLTDAFMVDDALRPGARCSGQV